MTEPQEASPIQEPEVPNLKKKREEKKEDIRQGLPSSVQVEVASAPMELDTRQRKDPRNQYIEYTGIGTLRVMTAVDWATVGVDDFTEYCEWNYFNKKRIPRTIFSDKALQYLLRQDGRFKLVEVDPEEDE